MVETVAEVPTDEIAPLLAVPLERFVEVRTARVKALKAEGHKAEATALARVRKPTRLVWLVGELARRYPDRAGEAADVARLLDSATEGVRDLMRRLRDAVETLAELAGEVAGPGDEAQVGLALRSVLGDSTARHEWQEGRLLALPHGDDRAGAGDDGSTSSRSPTRAQQDPPGRTPSASPEDELATRRSRPDRRGGARTGRRPTDDRPEAGKVAPDRPEEARRAEKDTTHQVEEAERAEADAAERVEEVRADQGPPRGGGRPRGGRA